MIARLVPGEGAREPHAEGYQARLSQPGAVVQVGARQSFGSDARGRIRLGDAGGYDRRAFGAMVLWGGRPAASSPTAARSSFDISVRIEMTVALKSRC